jgi:hypothetical protein
VRNCEGDWPSVDKVQVITPLILALQYFGAEEDILHFDRSPKTFVVFILILYCSLPILTYGLVLIHRFWDGFHRKISARSEKTAEFDEKFQPV